MLDPCLWDDPDVGSLKMPARLLFIGLISLADDEGRGVADPRQLKKQIFGFDDCTSIDVDIWLKELSTQVKNVLLYEKDGKQYYFLANWERYQKISHPSPSRIPAPNGSAPTRPPASDLSSYEARKEWESGFEYRDAHVLLLNAANTAALPGEPGWDRRIENVLAAMQQFSSEIILEKLKAAREAWIKRPRVDKKGFYSPLNPGWVDWGIAALTGPDPWEIQEVPSKESEDVSKFTGKK